MKKLLSILLIWLIIGILKTTHVAYGASGSANGIPACDPRYAHGRPLDFEECAQSCERVRNIMKTNPKYFEPWRSDVYSSPDEFFCMAAQYKTQSPLRPTVVFIPTVTPTPTLAPTLAPTPTLSISQKIEKSFPSPRNFIQVIFSFFTQFFKRK